MLNSLDDIKRAHKGHFFSNSRAHRSFQSENVYPVKTGAFFVDSIKDSSTTMLREYKVKFCHNDGSISTIEGGFYKPYQAHKAAKNCQAKQIAGDNLEAAIAKCPLNICCWDDPNVQAAKKEWVKFC